MYVEMIGIIASILILGSMLIQSTSPKGNFIMRIINLIGSVVFVVYGMMIPAYSTAVMNAGIAIVNIVYIIRMMPTIKAKS